MSAEDKSSFWRSLRMVAWGFLGVRKRSGYSQLVKLFKQHFRVVKPIKPKASRDKSSETFLVGIGLKGVSGTLET